VRECDRVEDWKSIAECVHEYAADQAFPPRIARLANTTKHK